MSATPASMLEMVDEADSKSVGGNTVWVQVPLLAPQIQIGEERMVDVIDLLWKQRVFITSLNERQQVRALLRSLYPHMTGIYEDLDDGWSVFPHIGATTFNDTVQFTAWREEAQLPSMSFGEFIALCNVTDDTDDEIDLSSLL